MISKEALLQNIESRYLYDEQLESVALGMIIMEYELCKFDMIKLKKHHFHSQRHKLIYECIEKSVVKNGTVDLLFVTIELKLINSLEAVGGPKFITQLTNMVASVTTFLNIVIHIIEFYNKRRIIDFTWQIFETVDTNPDVSGFQLIEDFSKGSKEIMNELQGSGDLSLLELTNISVEKWRKVQSGELKSSGILFEYPAIDLNTGGAHPGDLIVIGGRPGMGKTQLALNFAFKIAIEKTKVGFCSLEMTNEQLLSRLCSMGYEIYNNKFRNNKLTTYDITNIANGYVKDLPIELRDREIKTLPKLMSKIRKLVVVDGCKVIIIDYLQLIKSSLKNKTTNDEIGDITGSLKELAKELGVPIIALSQLSRKVEERADKRPNLGDLRDSGNIEQDADIICFCYRPWYYDKLAPVDVMEFNVVKNRGGALLDNPIELYAYMQYQQLSNQRDNRKLLELQQ